MREAQGQGCTGKVPTCCWHSRGVRREIPSVQKGSCRDTGIFPPGHSLWGGSCWELEGEWEIWISPPRTASGTTSSRLITRLPWCQSKYPQLSEALTYSEYCRNFHSPPFSEELISSFGGKARLRLRAQNKSAAGLC